MPRNAGVIAGNRGVMKSSSFRVRHPVHKSQTLNPTPSTLAPYTPLTFTTDRALKAPFFSGL